MKNKELYARVGREIQGVIERSGLPLCIVLSTQQDGSLFSNMIATKDCDIGGSWHFVPDESTGSVSEKPKLQSSENSV